MNRFLFFCVFFFGLGLQSYAQLELSEEGRYWRSLFQIERWEMDLDPDGDGLSSREEYYAGTDPRDAASRVDFGIFRTELLLQLEWNSELDSRYQILESDDLMNFQSSGTPLFGTGNPLRLEVDPAVDEAGVRHFFSLDLLAPLDRDDDGLSDREEAILGTNPDSKNTDGDTYEDGEEVFSTFTDPLVFDPAGGTIRGSLRLVASLTATFESGSPLVGKTVYLDSNFNGQIDDGERRTTTSALGEYEFRDLPPGLYEVRQVLEPGETQTLPSAQTPQLPDRLADEVVEYSHPESGAAMDEPYGYLRREVWPGAERLNLFPRRIEAVDPELLLLPIGVRAENPPIGSYPTSHHLALPETAVATVRFDETIIDKDGPDFIIAIPTQGPGGGGAEPALIAFGPSEDELFEYQQSEIFGGDAKQINEVDLADYPEIPFVNYIRVTSQTSGMVEPRNSDGGFGLVGFEALNFLPLNSEGRRVRILGTEVVENEDLALYFQDLPPSLILSPEGTQPQAGQPFTFRLIARDDLGISSLSAVANGSPVDLTSENFGTVTPRFPGELVITAKITDTGGQSVDRRWTFFVLDENGDLPYDPEVLAEQQGAGKTRIQVFSPNTGDVPTEDVSILASIVAPDQEAANWSVSYAPIDLVDPLDLSVDDPDYIEIGSGSGNVFSAPIATFPTTNLSDGIYFLKIEAIPAGGGLGNFYGQVIGVGVEPNSLRPQVEITSPEGEAIADLVQDITGSIVSEREITSWEVDYAPLAEIDLSNLGEGDAWKTIASGTEEINESVLGSLDTSLLPNGSYFIRVSAFNDLRLGRVEGIQIEVTSPAKPGRSRRIFTDLSLDLHGLPIKIDRVYDSLNRDRTGDFGKGWCLDVADANILETVPDTGLNLFGASPYRQGTRVYLNAPNGERVGFSFEAEFANSSLLGSIYRANFIPDLGNSYTLETPEGSAPFLNLKPNGEVSLTFIGLPWNPDRFILTSREGTKYSYHEAQGLTGIEDRNGNSLEYSESGITHSAGPGVVFDRDSEGRITTITAPGNQVWTYQYSLEGDLLSVTEPGDKTTTFGYDPSNPHFLTSVTDPFGRMGIRFVYDEEGRLEAIVDEFGNREEQSWDPTANTGTITDRNGNVTSLVYDDRGNVLTETDPLGNVRTFKYEDERHPDTETEIISESNRVRFVLNEFGEPERTFYGDSFFADTSTMYDEDGRVTERTNIGGQLERFSYDEKGNLLSRRGIVNPPFETFTYTPEGQIASRTVNGRTVETFYDPSSGMKAREVGPFGFSRDYIYSSTGRINTAADARGKSFGFEFADGEDRVSVTFPNLGVQTAALNGEGDLVRTDANGNSMTMELAYDGVELSRTLPDGQKVEREYDPGGNLVKMTLPGAVENSYGYDALNRQVSFTDDNGNAATTVYDADGRIVSRTNRNGKKISYTYNRFNLIETESWHAPDDSVIRKFTYTYRRTRLDSVTDGTSTWKIFGGLSQFLPSQLIYEFEGQEKFSLLTSWTPFGDTPVPTRVRVSRPLDGQLSTDFRAGFLGERNYGMRYRLPDDSTGSIQLRFDGEGLPTEIGRYNFFLSSDFSAEPISRTRMGYDDLGDLTHIRHENPDGSLQFPESEFVFDRDPGGRITARTQPGIVSNFSYDSTDQITAVSHSSFADEIFDYDLAGNPSSATLGKGNRLLNFEGFTFTYDGEGNVATQTNDTTGEVRTFSYDHRNQLIKVTSATNGNPGPVTLAEYKYDYRGRQMYRIENGEKTWILHERDVPYAEFADGASKLNRIYLYNFNKPQEAYGVWNPTDGIRWHLRDQIGSVHGIVAGDGSPLHWLNYNTFGQPRAEVPADFGPLRFAGRYYHSDIELYENTLRHYNPRLGRFQQQDPIRQESFDFNYYRYAGNNPLSNTDPLGTTSLKEYGLKIKAIAIETAPTLCRLGGTIAQVLVVKALLAGTPLPPGASGLGKGPFRPPPTPPPAICGP